MKKFDAVVIDRGQAGTLLAAKLKHEGQRAAIVERNLFFRCSRRDDQLIYSGG